MTDKCQGTKRDGRPCAADPTPGERWCWHHHPDHAEERRRNASRAATLGNSRIGAEIRSTRLLVRDMVEMTVSNELHPLVRKRLTEVVQLLQVYARLAELEIASMEAEGRKLPVFNAREALDVGLPEDTPKRVSEWVEGEEEKAERQNEGEQVLKEVATLAESRGHDAGDIRRFTG